jgi:hypothetical protein
MGASLVPGVIGSGGTGGTQPFDVNGFMQVALQLKQMKTQQEDKKKAEAAGNIDMISKNPSLLFAIDPKQVEKWFKDAGIKLADPGSPTPNPSAAAASATPQGTPAAPSQPQMLNTPGINLPASILKGAGGGNNSGAQAGNPASPEAAKKAPGGGVVDQAQIPQIGDEARARWGALAPLYSQGMSQLQLESMKAAHERDIMAVQDAAMKGDVRAMGRLYALAGKPITDSDIRGMVISSNMDPKIVNEALGFALGHESEADKSKRQEDMFKTIAGTPAVMERIDAKDIPTLVNSITQTGMWPQGVKLKNQTSTEMFETAKIANDMMEKLGYPAQFAFGQAQAEMMGIPNTQTLPRGFQTIPQLQAQTALLGLSVEKTKLQIEGERLKIEGLKDAKLIDAQISKNTLEEFQSLVDAKKAGVTIPKELSDGVLAKLGQEVGLEPKRVNDFWNFVTGGTHQELVPKVDTEALKGQQGPQATNSKPRSAGDMIGSMIKNVKTIFNDLDEDEKRKKREAQGPQ